eukprot:TRINITY_DN49666_c0_g1_i1.p1 TRINITY_DN49666_c0_g1~~TRINITY_DN49666_c0_g1_i1.p1  ORF type:complete len:393 (+),score=40.73 TRINITY_DN49666_c0_g1_i1:95-1180(+)
MLSFVLSAFAALCLALLPFSLAVPSTLVRKEGVLASGATLAAYDYRGCDNKRFWAACKSRFSVYRDDALARARARQAREGSMQPILTNGANILKVMQQALQGLNDSKAQQFLKALAEVGDVDGWDALALRETWTQLDTELLRAINSSQNFFPPTSPTAEALLERLPSARDFERVFGNNKSIAIVGNGPSLSGHGRSIDTHDTVARFNGLVKSVLDHENTGKRTDVHIMNYMVPWLDEANIHHFDLELIHLPYSFCRRFKIGAELDSVVHPASIFLLRPSVACGLQHSIGDFTRGFLFYWLVGRMFSRIDIYGMGVHDDDLHYDKYKKLKKNGKVKEPFTRFEHLVYQHVMNLTNCSERVLT